MQHVSEFKFGFDSEKEHGPEFRIAGAPRVRLPIAIYRIGFSAVRRLYARNRTHAGLQQ